MKADDSDVGEYSPLHKVLVKNGYRRNSQLPLTYSKDFTINHDEVVVAICLKDPNFDILPVATLAKAPDSLRRVLPHVYDDFSLCYVDENSVFWDRYDKEGAMQLVIDHVQVALNQIGASSEVQQEEFLREFNSYWNGEIYCYLLSTDRRNLKFLQFQRSSLLDGRVHYEFVIGASEEELTSWKATRSAVSDTVSGFAVLVRMKGSVNIATFPWPILNFGALIDWLRGCKAIQDVNEIIEKVSRVVAEEPKIVLLLDFSVSIVGLIAYRNNSNAFKVLRQCIKRHDANIAHKERLTKEALRGGEFIRLHVNEASAAFVTKRNLSIEKGLHELRVALIGCGTIGGYAAHMLAQSGAGFGGGVMELFDNAVLEPDNIGRHILGGMYIGEVKAQALTHWLTMNIPLNIEVVGIPRNVNKTDISRLARKFDLVVDTTGNQRFSTTLCHEMLRQKIPIPIVFGWVDAMGLVARALLVTGRRKHACYYCVNGLGTKVGLSEDIFRPNVKRPSWRRNRCGGGSFMPFSSQTSTCVAGLVQGICLDWANGRTKPMFRQFTIDPGRALDRRWQNIPANENCPCCGGAKSGFDIAD